MGLPRPRSEDDRSPGLEGVGRARLRLVPRQASPRKLACPGRSAQMAPGSAPGPLVPWGGRCRHTLGVPEGFGLAGRWPVLEAMPSFLLRGGPWGGPGRNVQLVGNQLMLSPSRNSVPAHAGVWYTMYMLYRDPVCTDLLAIHTRVPVPSVFCLFLIKTFLPPRPPVFLQICFM